MLPIQWVFTLACIFTAIIIHNFFRDDKLRQIRDAKLNEMISSGQAFAASGKALPTGQETAEPKKRNIPVGNSFVQRFRPLKSIASLRDAANYHKQRFGDGSNHVDVDSPTSLLQAVVGDSQDQSMDVDAQSSFVQGRGMHIAIGASVAAARRRHRNRGGNGARYRVGVGGYRAPRRYRRGNNDDVCENFAINMFVAILAYIFVWILTHPRRWID